MKELFSIRNREITYRFIIIAAFITAIIISVVSLIYANNALNDSKKNIYVLVNDNNLVRAKSTDITNSFDILAKAQIERVNQLIYQHVPDPENINKQLNEAMVMSDKSAANLIDALKTNNYYNDLVSQNFYSLLLTDSISINYSLTPSPFIYYGKLKIVRNNQTFFRKTITSGEIERTGISTKNNEYGFLIKKFNLKSDEPITENNQ
jgi:hypothetical protein